MVAPSLEPVSIQGHPTMFPTTHSPANILLKGQTFDDGVPSKMNYVSRNTETVNVRRNLAGDDDGMEFNQGADWDRIDVVVHNARFGQTKKTLEHNGFELLTEPLSTTSPIDFFKYSKDLFL